MKRIHPILTLSSLLLICGGIYASIGGTAQTYYQQYVSTLKDSSKSERDYFFPVLLENDREATLNTFATAVMKCDTSVLSRQRGIKLVGDSIPDFLASSKGQSSEEGIQMQVMNRFMVQKLMKRPNEIQILLDSRAFLGKDSPEDYTRAELALEKRKKSKTVPLPVSTQSKENLHANVKPNEQAEQAKLMDRCKSMITEKVNRNEVVILSEEYKAPIFGNNQLFKDDFLTEEERAYEYGFRFLIFCSAYPRAYAQMSPKVKNMMLTGNWYALYRFGKANLNPLNVQDQFARKQKMFQS
ncbi:MAG TPA: hypothetical protein PL185_01025 [Flavobacteriales bacterium]|nr:hypothetical protein [Flavobacteriales bacterium]